MATIVLVPGAWLPASAWNGVADDLRTRGHAVHPITLRGVGATTDPDHTDLDAHVADIVGLLEDADLSDVVLAGHSYGGNVVAVAAGAVADRLRHVVYIDSGPLPQGMAQFDVNPPELQESLRAGVVDGMLPPPRFTPEELGPQMLDGLDDAALERLRALATTHPFASLVQPAGYPHGIADVPTTLIACTFPLEMVQQLMAQDDPFFALLKGAEIAAVPTGHWPMFSEPKRLAELLDSIASH